jgi:hypothetical protein
VETLIHLCEITKLIEKKPDFITINPAMKRRTVVAPRWGLTTATCQSVGPVEHLRGSDRYE